MSTAILSRLGDTVLISRDAVLHDLWLLHFCHLHIYNIFSVLVPELREREYNTELPFRVEYPSVFSSALWLAVFLPNCCLLHTLL